MTEPSAAARERAREFHAEIIRWSGGWCDGDDCETCRQVIAAAEARVAEEREACARVADALDREPGLMTPRLTPAERVVVREIAARIRSRGTA